MASLIPGFEYDIFISYRQKDNKGDRWVSEFVEALKTELESTFKEEINVYFDINPHYGLLETHDVDASLQDKLKCLIFIPVISRTYCDPKSFAWEHEFKAFIKQASQDQFGLKIKLPGGNVANRVLPIQIHDLDADDKKLCEFVLGGFIRGIEFIYKEPGVDRPLTAKDNEERNLNRTNYRNQINKVALAIKEIVSAIKHQEQKPEPTLSEVSLSSVIQRKYNRIKILTISLLMLVLIILGVLFIPKLFKPSWELDKSIAVLPFVNLSNDPQQEYFSDGIVEAILNHLFKVGDLRVISATTTKRYKNTKLSLKEIARELGVSSILEGSVQKSGNNIRITAQLIDAKTDIHLWSEIYDKELSDIFSIQSEVAQNVARELKATLSFSETDHLQNAPLTKNQLAYDFYLKGNDYWSKFQPKIAIGMYSKAIKEDSLFAAAYARRAVMHGYCYWQKNAGWQVHAIESRSDIKKGYELNPGSPEVKFAEAVANYWLDRNYDKALKILKELKEEAVNMADLYAYTSYILRRQGKLEESIIELEHALKLDPLNANYMDNLIETYKKLHQYDDQIKVLEKGLSLIPDYTNFNYELYSAYLDKTGDLKTSIKESGLSEEDVKEDLYYYGREFDKLIELTLKDTTDRSWQAVYQPNTYRLSFIYYLRGNKSMCKKYADSCIVFLNKKLKETPNDERLYATLGKCYALTGNAKEAIEYGNKVINIMPVKKDATLGMYYEEDLMEIYLFTGNYDLALEKMDYLLSVPSFLDVGIILIDPIFDNLRSLPRFQQIIDNTHNRINGK